ncbi:unnamed protein product [Cylindrotheca closterium]|uniref:Uncharacterized protein n=1 Tax=Cylindrotheca closterium TaxID=2856 RepID=A0AAD2FUD7_9STRA|nr:unnamed protein product [Cylindrotheca closterium]
MHNILISATVLLQFQVCEAFTLLPKFNHLSSKVSTSSSASDLEIDSLMDMDIVIYSTKDDPDSTKHLGALQEDGTLSPLSVWQNQPVFDNLVEFLVDEEDRFSLNAENVELIHLVEESNISYGSRQCHRGVGNPHGEESELLYYVDQEVIDKFDIKVVVNPDLEILW